MLPWSQRGQRTTCRSQWAQLNRRPKFLIAAVDENGLDPRQNPHDTVHLGRAEHGSGGAAPALATKQTWPAPHRSQRPECSPTDLAVQVRGAAASSPAATGIATPARCG